MDNDLEQQTNGSMAPPPMPSVELMLTELPKGEGEWPVQMESMVDAEPEDPEQTELSPSDNQPVEQQELLLEESQEEPPHAALSPPPSLMSLEVENPEEDGKKEADLVLPKALEDVLALKTIRAQQLGEEDTLASAGAVLPGSYLEGEGALETDDENANEPALVDGEGDDSSLQEPDQGQDRVEGKQDKNRRKKKRKKENRRARREQMQQAHEQRLQQQQQERQQKQTVVSARKPTRSKRPEQERAEAEAAAEEEARRTDTDHSGHSADEGEGQEKVKSAKSVNGRKQRASDEQEDTDDDHQTNGQREVAMEDDELEGAEELEKKEDSGDNEKQVAQSKPRKHPPVKGKKGAKETAAATAEDTLLEGVEIEYVPEKLSFAELDPMYRQFYQVFEIFKLDTRSKETLRSGEDAEKERAAAEAQKKAQERNEDDDDDDDDDMMGDDRDEKDDKEKISKRKLKKLTRLSVAELKQLVTRPDVVEMHDVTARDPKLLVQLKSHRNTVQVPRHWCFKRKYLQGKRGIEKPPFDLPAFIKKTGIMEMRASLQEKDEAKTLKAKMRERARPKMGKIDIDYQKLHDAFFKWQTKPRMTIHGDLYYEGKEFETRLKEKKPGDLSEELRIALGMPIGPACHKIPPPWLIAQQRYGPPPSYPNLKIPGLNAPIPEGCSFGYHAGGWGKPPVDESGKPLYGDVFGMAGLDGEGGMGEEEIDRTVWGELESESEESSEEEEDEGEDLGGAGAMPPDESGLITPAEGLVTPSGLTSGVPAGMETPDTIELRKKKIESEMEDNETPVLYHVLPEKRNERIGSSMMASTHVYDIGAAGAGGAAASAAAAAAAAAAGGGRAGRGGQPVDREGMVELALDPSELDLDNEAMAQRYEQQLREQQSHLQKEDLSDMLAEHVARQKSKRKRQQTDTTSKQSKKYKEFKF
uniref:PSP proline-rich domain-containing protein n=1 Tax=Anopheles atroparvus TaxID=41427 RepID=A0A182J6V8_ANOAO